MVYNQGILNAKAEVLMMHGTGGIPINDNEEVPYILNYMFKTLEIDTTGEEVVKEATKFIKEEYYFRFLHLCTTEFGRMITIAIEVPSEDENFDVVSEDGVFCYVYNMDAPDCSELGYCFFKTMNNRTVRIG